MRLERLTYNKIKIFLTTDDLSDRGLTKDDIWKDSMKWNQLFQDMLEEASDEFGLEVLGTVAVEIFSLQAQGMVMIVTMNEEIGDDLFDDGFLEMQVTMEGREIILFEFINIEDVIQLAKRMTDSGVEGGTLFHFENNYYILMEQFRVDAEKIVSLMAEYGNSSLLSIHRIQEYGKTIIKENALKQLVDHFY